MIDIEDDVFDYVAKALRAAHKGVYVTGEYAPEPPKLPCVSIVEADNRVYEQMRTVKIENAAFLMYEINIYSNKVSGKKTEAKAIANTADEAMAALGFTRTFRNPIPNYSDATVYRIVCRYEAIAVPEGDKFRIYQN